MEGAPCQYKDRRVNQESDGQGDDHVGGGQAQGPMARLGMVRPLAGLHQGGVELEVVGHHRGPEDSHRQKQLVVVAHGQGQAKQQLQGDGTADQFGKVDSNHGHFGQEPGVAARSVAQLPGSM